jgi:hypothetical protein
MAMAAIGGGGDETPRLGGGAQRAEAKAPEGGGRSRRSSPELGEGRVGDTSRQRRIGLGFRPSEGESEGTAGLGQAGSVRSPRWTDRWAWAISQSFYF